MAPHRMLLTLVTVLVLVVTVAACSGNEDQQDTDPQQVVDEAAQTFAETESASFELSIDGSIPVDDAGIIALSGVEGQVERPSRAFAEASVQFAGSSVTMELVAADGRMYLRNVVTGQWEQAPTDLQYDPSRIFDQEDGIQAILAQLDNLEVQGNESVSGTDAWHLTGTVPTEAVATLTGPVFEGETLDVDAWVATDDHRILRVVLNDPSSDDTPSWELALRDHNEPVEITVPEIG